MGAGGHAGGHWPIRVGQDSLGRTHSTVAGAFSTRRCFYRSSARWPAAVEGGSWVPAPTWPPYPGGHAGVWRGGPALASPCPGGRPPLGLRGGPARALPPNGMAQTRASAGAWMGAPCGRGRSGGGPAARPVAGVGIGAQRTVANAHALLNGEDPGPFPHLESTMRRALRSPTCCKPAGSAPFLLNRYGNAIFRDAQARYRVGASECVDGYGRRRAATRLGPSAAGR